MAAGAEPEANLQKGRAGPNAIAHRQKVAAGAEPRANLQKGRAEPNAIAHRQKVAAGAEPKADPDERRAKPNTIALQDPKRAHQREENPRHWLEAFICTYFDEVSMGSVADNQIRFAGKFTAKALQYEKRGIPIDRIDTHLLLTVNGACTLKLAGYDDV